MRRGSVSSGIVISLLIVALLSIGALKAFAGEVGTGTGSQTLRPTVDQAYDVSAQSTLSNTMQNVRDGAISNGGLSASDLARYGVTPQARRTRRRPSAVR